MPSLVAVVALPVLAAAASAAIVAIAATSASLVLRRTIPRNMAIFTTVVALAVVSAAALA